MYVAFLQCPLFSFLTNQYIGMLNSVYTYNFIYFYAYLQVWYLAYSFLCLLLISFADQIVL